MSAPRLCDGCKAAMVELLENRIRAILQVGKENREGDPNDSGYEDIGQAHCFHLMEIRNAIEGKQTCGVFDDFGPPPEPPTIAGPLFGTGH